jgi:transposase-like protein
MTREERTAVWREIVERHEEGELSGAAFCREHHVNLSRFYHWRRRLKQESPGGFLELTTDPPSPRPGLSTAWVLIHLNAGVRIELTPDFDATTLRRAVEVLRDCSLGRQPCFP